MPTEPSHQPTRAGGPATNSCQASPTAASTPASGPPLPRTIRGPAFYQPRQFYNVAGINNPWPPQSRFTPRMSSSIELPPAEPVQPSSLLGKVRVDFVIDKPLDNVTELFLEWLYACLVNRVGY
ncbi:hypothetical protein B0H65DRAFT_21705 [Neurospora tetraspora]|uniref:Uncharacterized protein n=1 Tax=Neurospora tetraspora TaxID=94610 RepID=A0AAE0JN83_9PEZI|nr:hypothetical protein B0H65DRAFT_21705 [Neurospora tetraspora]